MESELIDYFLVTKCGQSRERWVISARVALIRELKNSMAFFVLRNYKLHDLEAFQWSSFEGSLLF